MSQKPTVTVLRTSPALVSDNARPHAPQKREVAGFSAPQAPQAVMCGTA